MFPLRISPCIALLLLSVACGGNDALSPNPPDGGSTGEDAIQSPCRGASCDGGGPDGGGLDPGDADGGSDGSVSPRPDGGGSGPINRGPFTLDRATNTGLPGMYLGGVARADFNEDGKVDLVFVGYFDTGHADGINCSGQIEARVFLNASTPGSIRFERGFVARDLGVCSAQVATGDVNGDGNADFVFQIKNGVDSTAMLGRGDGNFDAVVIERNFGTHSNSNGFAVADMDRDGVDDVVFNNDGGAEYWGAGYGLWYKWVGAGFAPKQADFQHFIVYGGTLAAGDLDGDGFPEIAVGGNSRRPFGEYDCSQNELYGQIHKNRSGAVDKLPLTVIANYALKNYGRSSASFAPHPERMSRSCFGGDNVQYLIADLDRDGTNDLVSAGSGGFGGRPEIPGDTHYSLAILRNVDGTGTNFVTWENVSFGPDDLPGHFNGNTTNSGVGNVDLLGIAAGDLNGDGWPEVVVQGHRRDHGGDVGRYIYGTMLIRNRGNGDFEWEPSALDLPTPIGAGGNLIADLDGDGKNDLLVVGAERPFHSNGSNGDDLNDASSIRAHVFRQR